MQRFLSTVLLVISITEYSALLFSGDFFYVECSTWNILYFYGYCYLKSLAGDVIIEICHLYDAFTIVPRGTFLFEEKFKE